MSWEATQRRKMASLVLPPRKLKLQTSCRPKSMLKCVSLLSHFFDVMRVFCDRGVNETDREVVCARSYRRLVSHPKIGFECEGVRSFKQILKIRIRWHCKEKRASWAWFALFLLLIKKCLLLFGNTGNNKKQIKSRILPPLFLYYCCCCCCFYTCFLQKSKIYFAVICVLFFLERGLSKP
jgi:hypothetical protein